MDRSTNHSDESLRRAMTLGVIMALAAAGVSGLLLHWSWEGLAATKAADTIAVDRGFVLLVGVGAGLTSAAVSWLAALGVLALAPDSCGAGGRHLSGIRFAPRWGPRAAAALLALSLSTPAAHAVSPSPASTAAFSSTVTVAVDSSLTSDRDTPSKPPSGLPGWSPTTPTLPGAAPRPQSHPSTSFVRSEPTSGVVVTRGDTLWDIAASDLQPGATNSEIATHWPRWYEANRGVIGPDPHLLLPGQILQSPLPPGAQP